MNIFVLSEVPRCAAQMLDDVRCRKMILESFQLLATAHRVLDGAPLQELSANGRKITRYHLKDGAIDLFIPKSTHINHPCNIWVRESSENYLWLYYYAWELLREFELRYGHPHSYMKYLDFFEKIPKNIPIKEMTPFVQCMPDKYKCEDSIKAYRNYFIGEKLSTAKWNYIRQEPQWVRSHLISKIANAGTVSTKTAVENTQKAHSLI
jgi:hypothetical protein